MTRKHSAIEWDLPAPKDFETTGGDEPPQVCTPPPPTSSSSDFPLLSTLPVTELSSSMQYTEVVATDVSSPPVLHVHIANQQSLQTIADLQSNLNSHSYTPLTGAPPPVGHVCCCKFSADDMWYRAVVTDVQESMCSVQFIDYGNNSTVQVSHLAPCPPEFIKVPVMALQCILDGVYPPPATSPQWPPETTPFLEKKCLDRVLLAKVESWDKDSGLPVVQLIDTSSEKDIYMSTELIDAGLAVSSQGESSGLDPRSTPVSKATLTMEVPVTHLPEAALPNEDEFDVLVTTATSFTELYIHPVTEDTFHNMRTFMESITEHCTVQTGTLTTPPSIGHYCLALFSDGNWCRAQVESVSPDGKVDVFFVDFGNRYSVQLPQVQPLVAQFAALPVQVLKCSLCGLLPEEALDPDPAACSLLYELSTGSKMVCQVVCRSPLIVDLISPKTKVSIREELAQTGKMSSTPPEISFTLPTCSIAPESQTSVFITHVEGPDSFWVQVTESPDFLQLPQLMQKIEKYCSLSQPSGMKHQYPLLGQVCCAQFSEDKVWYRAQVIGFPSLSECHVQFLDYGNVEVCPRSAIMPTTVAFLFLPSLAVHCALAGYVEPASGAGQEILQRFKGLVENKLLLGVREGTCQEKVLLRLLEPSSTADILQQMSC